MNRRTWRLALLIGVPALLAVDGGLAAAAYYASHSLPVGLGVFGFMFVLSGLELSLVGWMAQRRQYEEQRRARQALRRRYDDL